MTDALEEARAYLDRPYARVLTPDSMSGTFAARIPEFPGCVAQGKTPEEAYANLERTAESWLLAVIELGQDIPEPDEERSYSGRLLVRFPKSLHRRVAELASREGTSLNQLVVAAVAEKVGGALRAAVTTPARR